MLVLFKSILKEQVKIFLKQVTYYLIQNKWLKLKGKKLQLGELMLQVYVGAKLAAVNPHFQGSVALRNSLDYARILPADNTIHLSELLKIRIDSSVSWLTEFSVVPKNQPWVSVVKEKAADTASYTLSWEGWH